jgi:hypothetical protein
MDGRTNVAKAPEFMVSHRQPNPVEKANLASIPRPNSPLENTPHNAEDFKPGAPTHEGLSVEKGRRGTRLKIPLC